MSGEVFAVSVPVLDGDISLEAELYHCMESKKSAGYGIVLAHPHPKFGGNLHNNVISALFTALQQHPLCHSIIRFNFRGVQRSTGTSSWTGKQEREDVIAATNYMMEGFPSANNKTKPNHSIIIGYSYGSVVACGISSEIPSCIGTVAISLPLGWMSWFCFHSHYPLIKENTLPKLLIIGTADEFTSISTFKTFKETLKTKSSEIAVCVVPDQNHFWFGHENLVVNPIKSWLSTFSNT